MSACYLANKSGSTWPTITGWVGKIILKERMSFFPKAVSVSLQVWHSLRNKSQNNGHQTLNILFNDCIDGQRLLVQWYTENNRAMKSLAITISLVLYYWSFLLSPAILTTNWWCFLTDDQRIIYDWWNSGTKSTGYPSSLPLYFILFPILSHFLLLLFPIPSLRGAVHRTEFRLICCLTWIQTVIPTVIIMLKDFIFWNSPRNFAWFVTQFSKTFKIYFTMIEHGTMIPLQASKRPLYDLPLHNTHMQLCNVNSNQK